MIRHEHFAVDKLVSYNAKSPGFEDRLQHFYSWVGGAPELVDLKLEHSLYLSATGYRHVSDTTQRNHEYEPPVTAPLTHKLSP